jgi:hypothetical protein
MPFIAIANGVSPDPSGRAEGAMHVKIADSKALPQARIHPGNDYGEETSATARRNPLPCRGDALM